MKIYEVKVDPEPLCQAGTEEIILELIKDNIVPDDFSEITLSRKDLEKLIKETLIKGHYLGSSEVISKLNRSMK